jgi:hypothetical protein
MQLAGNKTKVTKWIHGNRCVLSTEVTAIRLDNDSDELYLEPAAVKFLDRMQQLADDGEIEELAKHGVVYVRRSAALS